MSKSVVIVSYNRIDTLESVLRAWLKQVDEVFLCDCSNKFETKLPITHIKFNPDPGNKTMHAMALLTQGDFVILADDDILPKPGLVEDLYAGYKNAGENCIVGLMGRQFRDEENYLDTQQYTSANIEEITPVDMLGMCYFSPRKYLAYDVRDMKNSINDLYWTADIMRDVEKWVVPSKNYTLLPSAWDGLATSGRIREFRYNYYKQLFNEYYKGKPKYEVPLSMLIEELIKPEVSIGEEEVLGVASIPRCGSTLLGRAIAGAPPGDGWIGDSETLKKMHYPSERIDRAVFLFGDVVKSIISTRLNRWDKKHFRNCNCAKPLDEVDIFKRDDLNYEYIFDYWTGGLDVPVLAIRYETMWENIDSISSFVGREIILPPKRERTTNLDMVTKRELSDILHTYSTLIRQVEEMPDCKRIERGGINE